MTVTVTREQVVAYRVAAQGLHRDGSSVADLAVLDLGVQEAMGQPAALAFAARLPPSVELTPGAVGVGPGRALALVWSLRGAPHVHRRRDLDTLAAALWPMSEADATTRLNETGPSVARAGIPALEQYATALAAMRDAVTEPIVKGAASTAVSATVPAVMRRDCRPCGTSHVSDPAMRVTSLAAGVELEPGTSPPVLLPRPGAAHPTAVDDGALGTLIRHYLRLLGPAGPAEVAGYLEARRADLAARRPADLADVQVDGRAAALPAECLDELQAAPAPRIVRLLGPFDPYLQARDRALIVPDTSVHRTLWPVLGRPGALLVDGKVAGAWRTKSTGGKLTITVTPFAPIRASAWNEIEDEAHRVGAVRGAADVRVVRAD